MARAVEEIIAHAVENPGGIGNMPRVFRDATRALDRAGAERYLAESAGGDLDMVGAFAGALADFGAWPIVMVVLLVLMALKIIENLMLAVFDLLPWGWGGKPKGIIHLIFRPLDNATTWLTNFAWNTATRMVIGLALLVRFLVQIEFPNTAAGRVVVNPREIQHLQNEIDVLQGQEARLSSAIRQLQRAVSPSTTVVNIDTSLEQRVKTLENEFPKAAHAISVLWNDVQLEAKAVTQLQNEVQRLSQGLRGVHQVVVSWQDIQIALENQVGQLGQQLGHTSAQTSANTDQITLLSPLALLLGGGAKGLKVLRSLEDKPCQCPRFGGLPGPSLDALAVLEFIENG